MLAHRLLEALYIVAANLVAKTARATMNLRRHLAREKPHALRRRLVQDLGHHVHFDKVVARAQRPHLVLAPLLGSLADLAGVGALQAAAFLGALQVGLAGVSSPPRPACPFFHQPIEFPRLQLDVAPFAYAAGTVSI